MISRPSRILPTSHSDELPSPSALAPCADPHRQTRTPLAQIDWQAHEIDDGRRRTGFTQTSQKISESEQGSPWKRNGLRDSHVDDDELNIFGSFDEDEDDVNVNFVSSLSEYSAPNSPYKVDVWRQLNVKSGDYFLDSPSSPSSELTSPGMPIWEDDWFKWRSRDECDSDDDDVPESKRSSKCGDFGGGPEDGLHLKCDMVWVF